MLAASFPKFGHPAFAWIALTPLLVAVVVSSSTTSPRKTFGLGLITGLVYYCGTLYWVVSVMQTFGGLSPVVAFLVGLLLWSFLSLYVGLFALLVRYAVIRFGAPGLWLSPAFWVATEWWRSSVGLSFHWAALGASQATVVPIAQAASVVGVFGLSAIVALVSTAAAAVSVSRQAVHVRGALAVGALLVAIAVGGLVRVNRGGWLNDGDPVRIGLVQGSVDQEQKYDDRFQHAIIQRYVDLSRRAIQLGAQVVIWPESSTPFFFNPNVPLAAPIRRLAMETRTPFLLGTDVIEPKTADRPARLYNAAMLLTADGQVAQTYRKMSLVPFGEYVPMKSLLFFADKLVEGVGDFAAGTDPVVFDADGRRMSVAICYESVYPDIARTFVQRGSQLLVTITNDAWFKRSSAAFQHFDQGLLRAIEEGRYVVRAANTGISGAVDPYGRVLSRTDLFVPAVAVVDVKLNRSRTIYSRVGDVTVWMSLALTAGVVGEAIRRRRRLAA